MDPEEQPRSFSAGRRWGIFFSVMVSIVAVTSIVLMLNYLGARYSMRFYLGANNQQKLSPLTTKLVRSLTNDVSIVVYYNRQDRLYEDISALLKEYLAQKSPHLSVETVDYITDPESAQKIRNIYSLNGSENKNLIIVASGDKHLTIPGEHLATTSYEERPDEPQTNGATAASKPNFVRHLSAFQGETVIDGCILSVTSKDALMACYTVDHDEPSLTDKNALGFQAFLATLSGCNVKTYEISLAGTNQIPDRCKLLIIAGPTRPAFSQDELQKVQAFLASGGRLLVLFNKAGTDTGLELLLKDWGVAVGDDTVSDPDATVTEEGPATLGSLMINQFNSKHPLVSPLVGSRLHLFSPRSIIARNLSGNNAPTATELAWTGPRGRITGNSGSIVAQGHVPVMVAVEKMVGVGASAKGETRIVVAGDSIFLCNSAITEEDNDNGNFARLAVNWLLDETPALQEVGPRRMVEYKLKLTHKEMLTIQWIFLAGMPGGILLFGGLVWLRRRQ